MLIKRQKRRVFCVLVDTFWYKFLFAGPRLSFVEQKDFSCGSLCRFLLSLVVFGLGFSYEE